MKPTDVNRDAAYEIPLSPTQLQQLGLLTAIWSQIDHMVSITIAIIIEVDPMKVEAMLDKIMTGGRIAKLRAQIKKIKDEDTRRLAKRFCDNMGPLIEKRNHITHGIWGWYVSLETKTGRRASYFTGQPKKPIFADDLPEISARCAAEAKRIYQVYCNLSGNHPEPNQIPQFFFADGDPPEWFPRLL